MGMFTRLLGGEGRASQERQARHVPAAPRPIAYRRLTAGPALDVVGESFHRDAIEAAVERRPEGHREVVDAVLEAEPDNEFDPNAIAVRIAGQRCGYLSRADAVRYRPVVQSCRADGVVPVVRADLVGGGLRNDGSQADYGVRLHIGSPARLLGLEEPSPPAPSRDHPWVGRVIAFTGDSSCAIKGEKLTRETSAALARAAGMEVHARVTRQVRLLVDCDDRTISGNQRTAIAYGLEVITEREFWAALGLDVQSA